jgi:hypothetical protein
MLVQKAPIFTKKQTETLTVELKKQCKQEADTKLD